jgi:acylphosphatase
MKKRVHLIVSGRVQGVCYRMYARDEAEGAGLTGWIRNLHNSRVEAVAEGPEPELKRFAEWCRRGPPHAMVANVVEEYSDATGEFDSFHVTY